MKETILQTKTYAFAIRIVKMYKTYELSPLVLCSTCFQQIYYASIADTLFRGEWALCFVASESCTAAGYRVQLSTPDYAVLIWGY